MGATYIDSDGSVLDDDFACAGLWIGGLRHLERLALGLGNPGSLVLGHCVLGQM